MPPHYIDTIASRKSVSVMMVKENKKIGKEVNSMPDKIEFKKEDLINTITGNLEKSMKLCESFFLLLNKKVTAKKINLRLTSISKFEAIFFITQKDFFSEDFKKMYGKAAEFSEKNKLDNYELKISFLPFSKQIKINTDKLINDGYFFSYEK